MKINNGILYTVLILTLITITSRSTNNMVLTTIPLYSQNILGFGSLEVGLVTAVSYTTTLFANSYLNPRFESRVRRRIFIASNMLLVISLFLLSSANGVTIFALSAIVGLLFGFIMPNIITSASLHGDRRTQERLLAIYAVSLSASLIIGPALETYLLHYFNYGYIFLFFIPISLLATAVSFVIPFPDRNTERRGKGTLRNDGFIASIITITSYNVPFAAITTFLAIFAASRFGVSRDVAYSSFIYFFLTSLLTRGYMAVRPFRRIKIPIVFSVALTVIPLLFIPFLNSYAEFLALVAFLGIPHGSVFPISSVMIARGTEPSERNTANSYFLAYNNVLSIAVPVIFGYMAIFLGYGYSFSILSIPVLLVTILLFKKYGRNPRIFYQPDKRTA